MDPRKFTQAPSRHNPKPVQVVGATASASVGRPTSTTPLTKTVSMQKSLSRTKVSDEAPTFAQIPAVQSGSTREPPAWDYITNPPRSLRNAPAPKARTATSVGTPSWFTPYVSITPSVLLKGRADMHIRVMEKVRPSPILDTRLEAKQ